MTSLARPMCELCWPSLPGGLGHLTHGQLWRRRLTSNWSTGCDYWIVVGNRQDCGRRGRRRCRRCFANQAHKNKPKLFGLDSALGGGRDEHQHWNLVLVLVRDVIRKFSATFPCDRVIEAGLEISNMIPCSESCRPSLSGPATENRPTHAVWAGAQRGIWRTLPAAIPCWPRRGFMTSLDMACAYFLCVSPGTAISGQQDPLLM